MGLLAQRLAVLVCAGSGGADAFRSDRRRGAPTGCLLATSRFLGFPSVRPASVWLRHSASALTTLSNLFQSVRVAALEVGRSTLLLLFRWTWKPSFRGLARSAAMEAWKSTWYEAIGKSAVNA